MGRPAAVSLRDAKEHDEAAARHMEAAVRCRDEGQVQRAVLEVKYAMLERQLARLERDKAKLETAKGESVPAPAAFSAPEPAGTDGAVDVAYRDGRWHVEVHGEPETRSIHEFRIAAIVVAHENARRARSELVIRGRDGAPRERFSYSDDQNEDAATHGQPEVRRALTRGSLMNQESG